MSFKQLSAKMEQEGSRAMIDRVDRLKFEWTM
jgi:hypothetical protein